MGVPQFEIENSENVEKNSNKWNCSMTSKENKLEKILHYVVLPPILCEREKSAMGRWSNGYDASLSRMR